MKSVMSHNFSNVPNVQVPRSVFNRSHGYKSSFDCSYLIPFYCDEALPGDTFKGKANIFARLATPIVPFMDNLFLETFFFFVPNRILWDNWEKFNGAQDDPGDSTDFQVPNITAPAGGFAEQSLEDYMGIPTKVENLVVNAFHHRAYNLIMNEWFRDQNLRNSKDVPTGDGPDLASSYDTYRRCKKHDYFTSCLPWPQKGDSVEIGLTGSADVHGNGKTLGLTDGSDNFGMFAIDALANVHARGGFYNQNVGAGSEAGAYPLQDDGLGVVQTGESGLICDLASATAVTINQLRESFQIQKMLEKDARGGTRYTEILCSHFGVTSPDFRLQRPEYIGGGSMRININPVQQTSSTDATTPQGNLAGYGVASGNNHTFNKSFVEHGVVIGLVNVRADITYQEGLNKQWLRATRYDYYWPSFAHLGEQAVLNREIYAENQASNFEAFGYQERYAEYRYKPSVITGLFRSNAVATLDYWHLSEEFGSLPSLNSGFIRDSTEQVVDRAIAVPAEPQILFDCYMELQCARPMPTYSVPGYIDHF